MSGPVDAVLDGRLVRGSALLLLAKLVTVIGGFALYFFLARVLTAVSGPVAGTAELGVWGATFGVMNPINTMAATGTLQTMSRAIASRGASGHAFARVARAQLVWVAALCTAIAAFAPVIARGVLNDPGHAAYLRAAAAIPVFYAARSLYEGYLNGTRRFLGQSLIDAGATLTRVAGVLAGAALGYGAMGAIGGFLGAAAAMTALAALCVRTGGGDAEAPPLREIAAFQAQVVAVTLATQYLINVDLLAVKALASPLPEVADRLAGYYTAAQKLAQVPLSIAIAIAGVLFSYVASSHARTAALVHGGMRVLWLLIVPSGVLLAVNAHETLLLVFPTLGETMRHAGDPRSVVSGPLVVMALAYAPYAVLLTCTTLITARGRPGLAAGVAAASLAIGALATRLLTPPLGPVGAALGVGLAWTLGAAAGALVVRWQLGAFGAPRAALRIVAASAVVGLLGLALETRGLWLLAEYLGLGVLFLVLLRGLGELEPGELARLARFLAGGAS